MRRQSILMSFLLLCFCVPAIAFGNKVSGNFFEKKDEKVDVCVVTGKVIDAKTGLGIPLATITVQGTSFGIACDVDGFFRLELPQGTGYSLLVRSIGYMEKRIKINTYNPAQHLQIKLSTSAFDLNQIVITGTRTEKLIKNAPVLTKLIPALQIQRNDFENIMDALEYTIPGLQFNSDPRGDNIRIQGLENKYILILVDGERLSNTPGGPIDFERLSTSNIKQIEVIKGAASALYGSSAIGMIINIITKIPERSIEGWAKVRYSKFNELLLDGSFGVTYKNITSQTLFNRYRTDGYDLTPESPGHFTRKPSANMTIEEKLRWTNKNTKINASALVFFNEQKNPKLSDEVTHYKSLNKTFRLGVEQKIGKKNVIKGVYYGDFYVRNTVYEALDSVGKNATSDVQTLRLTDVYTPFSNLQGIVGMEYNRNKDYNIKQFGEEIKTRRVHDINGFFQLDWKVFPKINIIGGFRYTHHSTFGNAYTPKINLMYSPGNLRLRTGYSKGFKAPDATELFSDFQMGSVSHNIGNPDLKAEHSNYWSFSAEYIYNRINISGEIYRNSIKDKIQSYTVLVELPNGEQEAQLRYKNVDDARIRGVEVSVIYRPINWINLQGTYDYTDAKDIATGLQLTGNTKHSFSWNAMSLFRLFGHDATVSLAGRWTSKKNNYREKTVVDPITGKLIQQMVNNPQDAYSLWKLTAQYSVWKRKNMDLLLTGGIQNIFDYTDPVNFSTYDPGRRFFSSVLFKF